MLGILLLASIWVGAAALSVILVAYLSQRWWKTRIGRFIVALKVALAVTYMRSIYNSIVDFQRFLHSSDVVSTALGIIGAVVLTYGAFAFVTTIRTQEK